METAVTMRSAEAADGEQSAETREAVSFCRICSAGCGIILTIDQDDRIVSARGDKESPLSQGYACFKGRQPAASHHGPERILRPLKRMPDGSYQEISSEQALDEIAAKLAPLIEKHGPETLAVFTGNGGLFNTPGYYMAPAFLDAFESDQYFSTLTIDQSGKTVVVGRLGMWQAGYPALEDLEVLLFIGANPLVSHGSVGFVQNDPVRRIKQAKKDGLKLITIDPRLTETGNFADIALQPYPGQDAAISGGLIRLILSEGWEDKEFCARWVGDAHMAALREAVEPLTEDYVEQRAGLQPGQLRAVAEMFARDSSTGCASSATGTSMAPYSNLAFQLIETLNVICGRYLREGQKVHRINGMGPNPPQRAQVYPPTRFWEEIGGASRIRGARKLFRERTTGTLPDEILTPGKGQIRALFVNGGDPLTSWPDQQKTAKALADIDLLVATDPWPSPTTSFAHYILPPLMQYERADLPMDMPDFANWPGSWSQYTPPAIKPPKDSDLVEDWYVFWAVAKRLGKTINYNKAGELDMETPPTTDDLIRMVLNGAPQTLDELKASPHGRHAEVKQDLVLPAEDDADGKFDPMPADVAQEMKDFLADDSAPGAWKREGKSFSHLLASRRMRDLFNSNGRFVSTVRERTPYNPAFLHPDEFTSGGFAPGDKVEIESAHGRVVAILEVDDKVRPGVVSLAHGWGNPPGSNADVEDAGTAVNRLIDNERHFEPINSMPHMSAIPVNIIPLWKA